MKSTPSRPMSLRVNAADQDVLDWLQERLGLKPAQLFKLGIRRLQEQEARRET